MGFVKKISKTSRKIRQTAQGGVQSGVGFAASTVQSGANLAGNTVKSGANLAGNTVLSGASLVGNTAQFGAGLAANTVQTGASLAGNTVLTGATLGVTVAAMGVGTMTDVVGGGVRESLNVAAMAAGGVGQLVTGSNGMRRQLGSINEMEIYCSDLYTVEFVLDEISKCKKSQIVNTLLVEDLLLRDDERLTKAAVNLVYKTTMTPRDEFDDDDDEHLPATRFERPWENMTFCECIATADDYRIYSENKRDFQANLRAVLKKKGVCKMPIKFTAKVEIAMLDMNEMIDLLHEIENDKAILSIKFPYMVQDIRKLPSVLANHFDEETLDWKDDAEPVEIHIKYGSKPPKKKGNRPTIVVRQCSLRLEHIVMNSTRDFESQDDDSNFFASGNSTHSMVL